MAHNDTEIELKFELTEERFNNVHDKVKELAKFKKISGQKDTYYTPAHKNYLEPKYPYEWLSVRERDNRVILNYKHFYPEEADVKTHCDEYNIEITDLERFNKLFQILDFLILVVVKKERWVYRLDDEFEIALDDVSELGKFVEIEAMKDLGGVKKTRDKLFALADKLGIEAKEAEKRGYPYLLMQKKGLLK